MSYTTHNPTVLDPLRSNQLVGQFTTLICCLIVMMASSRSFGQSGSSNPIPKFELANQTFSNAVLEIRNGNLVVNHSGGTYSHSLDAMYHKTLLRIGNLKPALKGSTQYQAALARYLPKVVVHGRTATGVKLQSFTDEMATFLSDEGEFSCKWSDLATSDRVWFKVQKNQITNLATAKREQEVQQYIANAQARAQEAERVQRAQQAAAVAQQEAVERQQKQAETAQMNKTAETVGAAVVLGAGAYLLYKLFNNSSSSSSSSNTDWDAANRANYNSNKQWEDRQNADAERREREAVERQWQQRRAEEEEAARRRAAQADEDARRRAAEADAIARSRGF